MQRMCQMIMDIVSSAKTEHVVEIITKSWREVEFWIPSKRTTNKEALHLPKVSLFSAIM